MTAAEPPSETPSPRQWLREVERLDLAIYAAIARTPTPATDRAMSRLSSAADYSRLWGFSALVLSVGGGDRGRRAAAMGVASVAVAATVVNAMIKPLWSRKRPDRVAQEVPVARHVRMPISSSLPSGHSAAGFAFATGVGREMPVAAVGLHALAAAVAYSRVHTGVHYPGDVIVGALLGTAFAQLTTQALDRN